MAKTYPRELPRGVQFDPIDFCDPAQSDTWPAMVPQSHLRSWHDLIVKLHEPSNLANTLARKIDAMTPDRRSILLAIVLLLSGDL